MYINTFHISWAIYLFPFSYLIWSARNRFWWYPMYIAISRIFLRMRQYDLWSILENTSYHIWSVYLWIEILLVFEHPYVQDLILCSSFFISNKWDLGHFIHEIRFTSSIWFKIIQAKNSSLYYLFSLTHKNDQVGNTRDM